MTQTLATHLAHCQQLNQRLHQLSEQEMAKLEALSRKHDPLCREQLHSARSTLALYTQNLQAAARLEQQLLRTDLLRQKEQRRTASAIPPAKSASVSAHASSPRPQPMPAPQHPASVSAEPTAAEPMAELDATEDDLSDEPAPLDDDAMLPPYIYATAEEIRRWLDHPSYIPPHERAELRDHMALGIYTELEDLVRRGLPLPGTPESTQSVPL